jgi:hypothetical protein
VTWDDGFIQNVRYMYIFQIDLPTVISLRERRQRVFESGTWSSTSSSPVRRGRGVCKGGRISR